MIGPSLCSVRLLYVAWERNMHQWTPTYIASRKITLRQWWDRWPFHITWPNLRHQNGESSEPDYCQLNPIYTTYYTTATSRDLQYDTHIRGRPWRYPVIPSTPDFQTEYQICRHSNPAGLPVFTAIWGLDFRTSIIILTHRPYAF